jgi:hypothetical protein
VIPGLALLLLIAATAPPPPGGPAPYPGPDEAAVAWFERETDACRAMIDVCEGGVGVRPPGDVGGLRCRAGRRGTATCRFVLAGHRCRAHFVSAAAGPAYARALQWSQLPRPAGHAWAVAWTVSPAPRGPRIRCTATD